MLSSFEANKKRRKYGREISFSKKDQKESSPTDEKEKENYIQGGDRIERSQGKV